MINSIYLKSIRKKSEFSIKSPMRVDTPLDQPTNQPTKKQNKPS